VRPRRLTAALFSNYHGDAAELNNIVDFATARHPASTVVAYGTLVSRIMAIADKRSAETAPFDTEICGRWRELVCR
jgi:hypothetical protein